MDDLSAGFGQELRRLRERAGVSLSAFANRVHYSKGFLSKIENGRAVPTPQLARTCDDQLGAGGALLALAVAERRAAKPPALYGLPPATRHFTGRQEELGRVARLLREPRAVVVLTGMAGAGKTELALRAAEEAQSAFPDGCLFLDLRGHTPQAPRMAPEDALDVLLRVLGVPGGDIPHDLDGRANVYRNVLRGKRLLLVLDNAADSAGVRPLLPAEPGCRVVVTSRNRLPALDDAQHVVVGELTRDEAVSLFRATAGDRPGDVARVVALCGHLPLAVRIAAARLRTSRGWTVDQLGDRLAVEASRLLALDDGERSVASAFALSVRGLDEAHRRLFALLGLHPGTDIELSAAAALAGHDLATVEHLLTGLDRAHLGVLLPGERVRLHDLVRLFAIEHVLPDTTPDDRLTAVRGLLDYVLRRTFFADALIAPHRFRPDLPPSDVSAEGFADRDAAIAWLDGAWPSLVAMCGTAVEHDLVDRSWLLAFLLHDYFFLTKLWAPWIELLEKVATATRAAGLRGPLAMTLNNLGIALADRGELVASQKRYREALEIFEEVGDPHGVTSSRSNLAWVDLYLGEHLSARENMCLALDAYRRAGADRNAAITLRGIALVEVELGSYEDALAHAGQALAEFTGLGLELDVVMTLNCLGWVRFRAGHLEEAAEAYRRAVVGGERCGSRYEATRARIGLGNAAAASGDRERAEAHWAAADEFDGALSPLMVGEARARADLTHW